MKITTDSGLELPRYKCHKEVRALKIAEISRVSEPTYERPVCRGAVVFGSACGHCERCKWLAENGNPGYVIVPEDRNYAGFVVDAAYVVKHKPAAGGYYVVYEDGYKSFSPASAFESGYTRIHEGQQRQTDGGATTRSTWIRSRPWR